MSKTVRKAGLALVAGLVVMLLIAGVASADEKGKELFASKGCAACHGANAEGKVGPALAGHSGEEIVQKVRSQSGTMPAFSTASISDAELHEIVEFIESLNPSGAPDEHHLMEALEAIEANNIDQAKNEIQEAIEKASADRKAQEQLILASLNMGKVREAEDAIKRLMGSVEANPTSANPATLPSTGDPVTASLLMGGALGGMALLGAGLVLRRRLG